MNNFAPMDRLTPVFERFKPQVHVQFAERLYGNINITTDQPVGHIHWLKSGSVSVHCTGQPTIMIHEPSVIFVPSPVAHRLTSDQGAELICAQFEFGQRYNNPLTSLGPPVLVVPVAQVPEIQAIHGLLMAEAFSQRCGRSLAARQLLQYFLLILFRHLIQTNAMVVGPLKALSDEKLLRAVTCMHRDPGQAWTLDRLAEVASMSRATFARRFKELMGKTALEYLTDWRLSVAQTLMAQGMSIKTIAAEVGYSSTSVLTRIFTQRIGTAPSQWLSSQPPLSLPTPLAS